MAGDHGYASACFMFLAFQTTVSGTTRAYHRMTARRSKYLDSLYLQAFTFIYDLCQSISYFLGNAEWCIFIERRKIGYMKVSCRTM